MKHVLSASLSLRWERHWSHLSLVFHMLFKSIVRRHWSHAIVLHAIVFHILLRARNTSLARHSDSYALKAMCHTFSVCLFRSAESATEAIYLAMDCKRDNFNGTLGGARETHWERVSHCRVWHILKSDQTQAKIQIMIGFVESMEGLILTFLIFKN